MDWFTNGFNFFVQIVRSMFLAKSNQSTLLLQTKCICTTIIDSLYSVFHVEKFLCFCSGHSFRIFHLILSQSKYKCTLTAKSSLVVNKTHSSRLYSRDWHPTVLSLCRKVILSFSRLVDLLNLFHDKSGLQRSPLHLLGRLLRQPLLLHISVIRHIGIELVLRTWMATHFFLTFPLCWWQTWSYLI